MPMRPHPYQDRTENAGNRSHEEASTDTDPKRHLARLPDLRTQCGWHREGAFGGRFLHAALDRGDSVANILVRQASDRTRRSTVR